MASAVQLDAKISSLLLQTIFFKNSPLHDCAVIINREGKIVAAKAVLPLTPEDELNQAKHLGTRHRAAMGISEETDAVALVVSEETGAISIACGGKLERNFTGPKLEKRLNELLSRKQKISLPGKNSAPQTKEIPGPVQGDLFEKDSMEEKQ